MLVEIDKPDPGAVAVANNKVQIYYPRSPKCRSTTSAASRTV